MCGTLIASSIVVYSATQAVKSTIASKIGAYVQFTFNPDKEDNIYGKFLLNEMETSEERKAYEQRVINVFNEFVSEENVVFSEYTRILNYNNIHLVFEEWDEYWGLDQLEGQRKELEGRYVRGVNNTEFTDLLLENIYLVEGRSFTQEELDNGTPVAIISKDYQYTPEFCSIIKKKDSSSDPSYICQRELTKIKIGDKVPFDTRVINEDGTITEYQTMYEIIGFFVSEDYNQNQVEYPKGGLDLNIYVPQNTLENELEYRMNELQLRKNTQSTFSSILNFLYKLDTPDMDSLEAFCERINQRLVEEGLDDYIAVSSADTYEAVAGPLESLRTIARIILIVSIIISIIIITLVNILFLRERRYEMGILASMGEKKKNIVLQIVLEVLIIGMLATSCSIYAGNIIGDKVSSKILDIQTKTQQEVIEKKLLSVRSINVENVTSKMVIQQYDVQLNTESIILIYLACATVLIITSLGSSYYVLRMKPKDIML